MSSAPFRLIIFYSPIGNNSHIPFPLPILELNVSKNFSALDFSAMKSVMKGNELLPSQTEYYGQIIFELFRNEKLVEAFYTSKQNALLYLKNYTDDIDVASLFTSRTNKADFGPSFENLSDEDLTNHNLLLPASITPLCIHYMFQIIYKKEK